MNPEPHEEGQPVTSSPILPSITQITSELSMNPRTSSDALFPNTYSASNEDSHWSKYQELLPGFTAFAKQYRNQRSSLQITSTPSIHSVQQPLNAAPPYPINRYGTSFSHSQSLHSPSFGQHPLPSPSSPSLHYYSSSASNGYQNFPSVDRSNNISNNMENGKTSLMVAPSFPIPTGRQPNVSPQNENLPAYLPVLQLHNGNNNNNDPRPPSPSGSSTVPRSYKSGYASKRYQSGNGFPRSTNHSTTPATITNTTPQQLARVLSPSVSKRPREENQPKQKVPTKNQRSDTTATANPPLTPWYQSPFPSSTNKRLESTSTSSYSTNNNSNSNITNDTTVITAPLSSEFRQNVRPFGGDDNQKNNQATIVGLKPNRRTIQSPQRKEKPCKGPSIWITTITIPNNETSTKEEEEKAKVIEQEWVSIYRESLSSQATATSNITPMNDTQTTMNTTITKPPTHDDSTSEDIEADVDVEDTEAVMFHGGSSSSGEAEEIADVGFSIIASRFAPSTSIPTPATQPILTPNKNNNHITNATKKITTDNTNNNNKKNNSNPPSVTTSTNNTPKTPTNDLYLARYGYSYDSDEEIDVSEDKDDSDEDYTASKREKRNHSLSNYKSNPATSSKPTISLQSSSPIINNKFNSINSIKNYGNESLLAVQQTIQNNNNNSSPQSKRLRKKSPMMIQRERVNVSHIVEALNALGKATGPEIMNWFAKSSSPVPMNHHQLNGILSSHRYSKLFWKSATLSQSFGSEGSRPLTVWRLATDYQLHIDPLSDSGDQTNSGDDIEIDITSTVPENKQLPTTGGMEMTGLAGEGCIICKGGENDDVILLCDGCNAECHIYCLDPPLSEVPDTDWFCDACIAQGKDSLPSVSPPSREHPATQTTAATTTTTTNHSISIPLSPPDPHAAWRKGRKESLLPPEIEARSRREHIYDIINQNGGAMIIRDVIDELMRLNSFEERHRRRLSRRVSALMAIATDLFYKEPTQYVDGQKSTVWKIRNYIPNDNNNNNNITIANTTPSKTNSIIPPSTTLLQSQDDEEEYVDIDTEDPIEADIVIQPPQQTLQEEVEPLNTESIPLSKTINTPTIGGTTSASASSSSSSEFEYEEEVYIPPFSHIEMIYLEEGVREWGKSWERILIQFPFGKDKTAVDLENKNLEVTSKEDAILYYKSRPPPEQLNNINTNKTMNIELNNTLNNNNNTTTEKLKLCKICSLVNENEPSIVCGYCDLKYHLGCHSPALNITSIRNNTSWMCNNCVAASSRSNRYKNRIANTSLNSEYSYENEKNFYSPTFQKKQQKNDKSNSTSNSNSGSNNVEKASSSSTTLKLHTVSPKNKRKVELVMNAQRAIAESGGRATAHDIISWFIEHDEVPQSILDSASGSTSTTGKQQTIRYELMGRLRMILAHSSYSHIFKKVREAPSKPTLWGLHSTSPIFSSSDGSQSEYLKYNSNNKNNNKKKNTRIEVEEEDDEEEEGISDISQMLEAEDDDEEYEDDDPEEPEELEDISAFDKTEDETPVKQKQQLPKQPRQQPKPLSTPPIPPPPKSHSTKNTNNNNNTSSRSNNSDKNNNTTPAYPDDSCYVCRIKGGDPERIIVCDGENCKNECHFECATPPIKELPQGMWYCNSCTTKQRKNERKNARKREPNLLYLDMLNRCLTEIGTRDGIDGDVITDWCGRHLPPSMAGQSESESNLVDKTKPLRLKLVGILSSSAYRDIFESIPPNSQHKTKRWRLRPNSNGNSIHTLLTHGGSNNNNNFDSFSSDMSENERTSIAGMPSTSTPTPISSTSTTSNASLPQREPLNESEEEYDFDEIPDSS